MSFVSLSALKSEKVKLVACGRDHTIVYTCKMKIVTKGGNNSYCLSGISFGVCVFLGQRSVYGAGRNQTGQLGLGHCNNTESFHRLSPAFDGAAITMLSAGCNTSAALTGRNSFGLFH